MQGSGGALAEKGVGEERVEASVNEAESVDIGDTGVVIDEREKELVWKTHEASEGGRGHVARRLMVMVVWNGGVSERKQTEFEYDFQEDLGFHWALSSGHLK